MINRIHAPNINFVSPHHHQGPVKDALSREEKKPFPQNFGSSELSGPGDGQAGGFDTDRRSAGLATVEENLGRHTIKIGTILKDFHSTLNALGADDETRGEVAVYLNAVSIQARQDQPEVPFIKHTLRTAGKAMDRYISHALGEPSSVVKDWVDALLLQQIDYHGDASLPAVGQPVKPSVQNQAESEPADLDIEEKRQLKALVDEARQLAASTDTAALEETINQALVLLNGRNRPDVEGKLLGLLARHYDKNGRREMAVSAYRQAGEKFRVADVPDRQARALFAAASILDEAGKLDEAAGLYETVLALDEKTGDAKNRARTLNELGSLHFRRDDSDAALARLKEGYQVMRQLDAPPAFACDLLSNLAAVYRAKKQYVPADKAYKLSLKAARASRDRQGYNSTLQALAAMYLEADRPEDAMNVLSRLRQAS